MAGRLPPFNAPGENNQGFTIGNGEDLQF